MSSRMDSCPAMSVVLVAPGSYSIIRRTMRHLQAQTVATQLEVVIVAPSRQQLQPEETDFAAFAAVQIIEAGLLPSVGWGNALGIRRARAPLVALTEDHVLPAPDWAEALIAAHQQSARAVVGPQVENANPGSLLSWADFLIGYSPWAAPAPAGERDFLPGHNSCYRRDLLLGLGGRLDALMEAETVLHWELRAKGYSLYLEPRARIGHINFSRLSSWSSAQLLAGRVFGATRARQGCWSLRKRLLYFGAGPLIPLVRLRRILRSLRSNSSQPRLVGLLPTLLLGLSLDALGQMLGYAFGAGDARRALAALEFHRDQHLRKGEREHLEAVQTWTLIAHSAARS